MALGGEGWLNWRHDTLASSRSSRRGRYERYRKILKKVLLASFEGPRCYLRSYKNDKKASVYAEKHTCGNARRNNDWFVERIIQANNRSGSLIWWFPPSKNQKLLIACNYFSGICCVLCSSTNFQRIPSMKRAGSMILGEGIVFKPFLAGGINLKTRWFKN